MQKELVELLKVILSKRILKKRQIEKCIPRATKNNLESKVEEQRRKIDQLQKDIAELERKLKRPRPEPELIPVPVDSLAPMRARTPVVDAMDMQEAPPSDMQRDEATLLTAEGLKNDKYKPPRWLVLNNVVVCQNARLISDQLTSAEMVKDGVDADGNPVAKSFRSLRYKKYKSFTVCVLDNNVLVGAETLRKAKNGWKKVVEEFSISMSSVVAASWNSEEYEGYQVKYSEDGVDVEVPLLQFLTTSSPRPKARSTKRHRGILESSNSEEDRPGSGGKEGGADRSGSGGENGAVGSMSLSSDSGSDSGSERELQESGGKRPGLSNEDGAADQSGSDDSNLLDGSDLYE